MEIILLVFSVKLKKSEGSELYSQNDDRSDRFYPKRIVEHGVSSEADLRNDSFVYNSKASLITDFEKKFYSAFIEIIGDKYIIQPQINLASVIDKNADFGYRNELFRNIDFGIFDKDYKVLLLIEINDKTHEYRDRRIRDEKVKAICAEAGIPLITFWTKYGIDKDYIERRLNKYLNL